ncbi:MAG TPA: RNA 2',3'-cyclic phosphodiesterase [Dehalococcoidia bacterium]|nr:RNA 2',3'-cyclic phosphodiesterase [Dehalococcoidia bacterium]
MSDGDLRLFVAIELPDDVREALGRVQEDLKRRIGRASRQPRAPVRWTRPEGIHVTLKFLGATPPSRVGPLIDALRAAVPPFRLSLQPDGVGNFGGKNNLRTLWVGLEGDVAALAELAGAVDRAVRPLGYAPETRPFRAHLTLARLADRVDRVERAALHAAVMSYAPPALPPFVADRVSLMKSTLAPGGSIYERLASFPGD